MGFSISVPFGGRGRAPRVTIYQRNGGSGCGIGCAIGGVLMLAIALLLAKSCAVTVDAAKHAQHDQAGQNTTKQQATAASASNSLSEPDPIIAELMFRKSLRNYLNDPDSYKPGLLRHGAHPQGYAFIQEFRAKNAFGAMIKQSAGLLAATNTGEIAWTFYTPDQTPGLLREVMKFKAETLENRTPEDSAKEVDATPPDAVPSTGRRTPLPLVDVRERVAAMAEDHVRAKLSPKRLQLLDLERRELETATLWIQRVSADGKTYRTGVLQTGDDLKLLTPAELKPHLLRQSH